MYKRQPIEIVVNNSPTGDTEEQKGVTEEVEAVRLKRMMKWKDGFIGRSDREYPHPQQWTIDMCPGRKPLDKIGGTPRVRFLECVAESYLQAKARNLRMIGVGRWRLTIALWPAPWPI